MQPEDTKLTEQTPQVVAPELTQNKGLIEKKTGNAGRSTMFLGIFMLVISLISILGVSSLEEDKQAIAYVYMVVIIILSIYWIVAGKKIKNSTNPIAMIPTMTAVMISAFIFAAVTFIEMILSPDGAGFAGFLSLLLAVYLGVAIQRIKKLSSNF